MLKAPSGTNWEFDGFKVMKDMRLLIAGGTPVPLTSKAFDTLVVLIENTDRVVTKDELLRSVWPDVEVEEGNLTQQIFLLRKALGETAQQPRYIVTIPGHGYRFTAHVNAISDDSAATAASTNGAASPPAALRRGVTFIGTGLAVVRRHRSLGDSVRVEVDADGKCRRAPGLHEGTSPGSPRAVRPRLAPFPAMAGTSPMWRTMAISTASG